MLNCCVCVSVCDCIWQYVHLCTCRSQRKMFHVLLFGSLLYSPETGSLTEPKTRLAANKTHWSSCLCTQSTAKIGSCTAFYVHASDSNSDLRTQAATTLAHLVITLFTYLSNLTIKYFKINVVVVKDLDSFLRQKLLGLFLLIYLFVLIIKSIARSTQSQEMILNFWCPGLLNRK